MTYFMRRPISMWSGGSSSNVVVLVCLVGAYMRTMCGMSSGPAGRMRRSDISEPVMRGLDPLIHDEVRHDNQCGRAVLAHIMDCRVKPGNDREAWRPKRNPPARGPGVRSLESMVGA